MTLSPCRLLPAILAAALLAAGALPVSAAQPSEWTYEIRPGDSLWRIAERHLDRPTRAFALARHNRLADADRLQPGRTLLIPLEWMAARDVTAVVTAAGGQLEAMTRTGGVTAPPTVGERIGPGQEIATGATGSVTLELPDASRIRLNASSRVRIETLRTFGDTGITDTRITVRRGSTEGVVTPSRPPASRFEINTPAAVTAVRGTSLRVGTGEGEATAPTRVEVITGQVVSGNARGTTEVGARFGLRIEADRMPGAPLPLLPPPAIDNTPALVDRIPVEFDFPPSPGASGWRVQVVSAAGLPVKPDAVEGSVRVDRIEKAPRVRAGDLADGDYRLAIRAIDGNGIEGLDAVRPFTVRARPEPPVLVDPPSGAALTAERPAFRWAVDPAATEYRLQVSARSDFGFPVVDTVVSTGAFTPSQPLPPGQYHWRVATRGAVGGTTREGPFSDNQTFRRLVPGPAIEAPATTDSRLSLRWRAAPDARGYQYQLASDAGFERLVADTQVDTAVAELPRPAPGRYWLRVRAIDGDGQPGPYGTAQSFELTAPEPPPARWPWLVLPVLLILIGL
jgi:hypothetical protein